MTFKERAIKAKATLEKQPPFTSEEMVAQAKRVRARIDAKRIKDIDKIKKKGSSIMGVVTSKIDNIRMLNYSVNTAKQVEINLDTNIVETEVGSVLTLKFSSQKLAHLFLEKMKGVRDSPTFY